MIHMQEKSYYIYSTMHGYTDTHVVTLTVITDTICGVIITYTLSLLFVVMQYPKVESPEVSMQHPFIKVQTLSINSFTTLYITSYLYQVGRAIGILNYNL